MRKHLGSAAKKVPTRQLPDWLVRFLGRVSPAVKGMIPLLGNIRNATSAKAQRVLGWTPRSREETIVDTARSLLKFGVVH